MAGLAVLGCGAGGLRDWRAVQAKSDSLLSEGIFRLLQAPAASPASVREAWPGNYLISRDSNPLYIGEASSLAARIKVQFDEKRSTFYKNYLKINLECGVEITEFQLRIVETRIGRKEIEDFGIVNLGTSLNRFQLGKRQPAAMAAGCANWDALQDRAAELIPAGADLCLEQSFQPWRSGRTDATAGIYLIKDPDGQIIYVGESSDIFVRYQTHSGTTYFLAVRRNLGCDILGYTLQARNGKKRYFDDHEDQAVSDYLGGCSIAFCPVTLGRYEVEEFLIRKLRPVLNRRSKEN